MSDALINDLKQLALEKITDLHNLGARGEVLDEINGFFGLQAKGLGLYQRGGIDLKQFGEVIEGHEEDLFRWVSVYAATAGMMAVWSRIVWVWLNANVPPVDPLPEEVTKAIDIYVGHYVRMIAN